MTEIASKRVSYAGLDFDSVLEADWYVTLVDWGLDVVHHPGQVRLASGGWWEPDFAITGWDGVTVLGEAKGPSDQRIEKPREAEEMHSDLGGVVILRTGLVIPGTVNKCAGACFHAPRAGGLEWVLAYTEDGGVRFTRSPFENETVFVSAERCIPRPDVYGMPMGRVPR